MNTSLSILCVTNNYTPYQGGVVSSLQTMRDALCKQGHTVNIITLDFTGKYEHEEGIYRIPSLVRFKYKTNYMAIPWRAQNYIQNIITKLRPDIVHVHHPFLLGPHAVSVARQHGIPVIFTYHTQYEEYLHYVPVVKGLIRPFVMKRVNSFCQRVDSIIVPSNSMQAMIVERGITTHSEIIPSGINPLFLEQIDHARMNDRFELLTVSRFVKEKNIPALLRVVRTLDDKKFRFTLIGYGPETASLQDYAYNSLGFSSDHVRFILNPSKEELRSWYARSNLFLFASKTETQGIVLAEAMAQRLPAVAFDAPGSRDIVEHGYNGFLVYDEGDMRDTITMIAQNTVLQERLSEHARKTAQNYDPALLTHRLLTLYRSHI